MDDPFCGEPSPVAHPGDPMDADETDRMLEIYRRTGDRRTRNAVVEAHLQMSRFTIRRLARGNASLLEDLQQVALLAIVNAAERYRPGHGATFRTFAGRTIDGELKRHLRDRTWVVRPPRGRQEQFLHACRAREELTHSLGRAPVAGEIAERTGLTVDEVMQALEAGGARSAQPLEPARAGDDSGVERTEVMLSDQSFANLEHHLDLRSALHVLDDRERRVLRLRYIEERAQPEIAGMLGLSQSYVSRIIRGALGKLRAEMEDERSADTAETDDGRADRLAPDVTTPLSTGHVLVG